MVINNLVEESQYNSILTCPRCGESYLHHIETNVYERGEDDKTGVHIKIRKSKVIVDNNMDGNPSRRRHGMIIGFYCEHCNNDKRTDLIMFSISQHKGQTFIEIENSPEVI